MGTYIKYDKRKSVGDCGLKMSLPLAFKYIVSEWVEWMVMAGDHVIIRGRRIIKMRSWFPANLAQLLPTGHMAQSGVICPFCVLFLGPGK